MRPLVVLAAVFLALVVPAQAAPGDLDPTFGAAGRQITDFGAGEKATDVAIQPDGRIVVAGIANGDFALARYHPEGSLDATFRTDFGGYDRAAGVALQPDGKIVVAGAAGGDFALARYNADGSLDTGFSADGKLTTDFDGGHDEGADVLVQPDGRIVVAGSSLGGTYDLAIARYGSDGSLDPSFAADGTQLVDLGMDDMASAIALRPDGRIVVAGQTGSDFWGGYDFALVRLGADGALDPSFGIQATDFGGDDLVQDVALQPDGRIVAVGLGGPGGYDFALARYSGDGSLDPGFSGDGTQLTHFDAFDGASGVAIQPDGAIVVAGHAGRGPGPTDFALARYGPDGSLDATFSGDGRQTTDFGSYDEAAAVALQADGRIVAAGQTTVGGSVDFALARYEAGATARPGAIAGTVRSSRRKAAIAGAVVTCGGHSATTAGNGTYSVPDLAPATYFCKASAGGHWPSTRTVTVVSGQTTFANFILTRR